MRNMRRIFIVKICFLLLFTGFGAARAQTPAFTYQGKLTDLSAAANGQYDFVFKLFDADNGGTQIGNGAACNGAVSGSADAVCGNVSVTNGIFTVNLDFGANAFTGGGLRFLEISVRPGANTGAYTTLAPRQQVTSAPFSVKTLNAASADSLSAACVLCVTDAQIQTIDGSKITGTVASATTAANVSGIVPIANGGTGSSTKNFVDLSTNQNIFGNKTFNNGITFNSGVTFNQTLTINGSLEVPNGVVTADQFYGNGDGLVNVPGTFKWQTVSGLAQQAQANTGYVATNDAQVTITLPQNLGAGETVRVSGAGAGGWKIAQNDGQSIIEVGINLVPPVWTPRESNRQWTSVASSADGTRLVAVVRNGQIYTSDDTGATWTPRESNREWNSVASSADGTKLVATVRGGQIFTSTDSGVTWTPRDANRNWSAVASSADGTKLAATEQGGFSIITGQTLPGKIYTSIDSGVSWTPQNVTDRAWFAVASSADGTKLVAAISQGQIFTSIDSGVTWTQRTTGSPLWQAVASSADGTKLLAAGDTTPINISNDSGITWTPRESSRIWTGAASSADGTRLAVVTDGGQIYFSIDSGLNWTALASNRVWSSVAMSADGTKVAATTRGGQIYTANIPLNFTKTTTPGTAGYLTGGQFTSIELQYIGNGRFLPISIVGAISGF